MIRFLLPAEIAVAVTLLWPVAQPSQAMQLRHNAATGQCWQFQETAVQLPEWQVVASCPASSSQGVSHNPETGECRDYDAGLPSPWAWAPQCQIGVML